MDENLKFWVGLNLVLADQLILFRKVLEAFPSPYDVFKAGLKRLEGIGLDEARAKALSSPAILDEAQKAIDRMNKIDGIILLKNDDRYPEYLREVFDPPYVLYCAGRIDVLKKPAVAMVGSRKPTPYGRAVAEKLSEDLASRGLVIASGMARGIDSLAHKGALKGGLTIAVLGSGFDNIYPRENVSLFKEICEQGAVISEFPLSSPPLGFHFPIRNRIITGLSLGVIVVEATMRSGSLISARLALEQNREVMAIPGNITSEKSRGTNWLIKNGAKPISIWEDVVEELPSPLKEEIMECQPKPIKRFPSLSPLEEKVYNLLRPDEAAHIDEIAEACALSVSEILSGLLTLEIKDLITQMPGKYFQRKP